TSATFNVNVLTNATLPFFDDFNRPDNSFIRPDYNEPVGDFSVKNNTLQLTTGSSSGIATLRGVAAPDISVQALVTLAENSGGQVALLARYTGTGDSNYYMADIVNSGTSFSAQIWRNVGGGYTLLSIQTISALDFPITSGTTHGGLLRFDVIG